MPSYGRGVAGGAHSGGTQYGTGTARAAEAFLSPEERGSFLRSADVLQAGGMTPKIQKKYEKRLRKGKISKAYRQAAKGFGKMQSAEQNIGKLREQAAGRALGAFREQGMQLSKPWQLKQPPGLLKPTEVDPFDYSGLMGERITTKKLQKRLTKSYGYGGGPGVKGQLGELVQSRGFAPKLQWQQHTAQAKPKSIYEPQTPYTATAMTGGVPFTPDYGNLAALPEDWDPTGLGDYGGSGTYGVGGIGVGNVGGFGY